jgi:hypothetical protein
MADLFSEIVVQRFWDKVEPEEETGCLIWGGARTSTGYGRYSVSNGDGGSRNYRAHRFAWMLTNGDIPRTKELCHKCDVRLCVNPQHLFLGTHRENMLDAQSKGRLVVPEPPQRGRGRLKKKLARHRRIAHPEDLAEIVPHEYAPSELEDFGNDEAGPEDHHRGDSWRWEELFD